MDANALFNMGQEVLRSQAFSRLLGTKLVAFLPGTAVLEIPITEHLLQQNGFVHGGVLSYAADNALTFVGGSILGSNVLTSEYKINYLKPAIGQTLIARASVVYAGKRQAVCRCEVFTINGQSKESLCATALGTIVAIASESTNA